MVKTKPFFFCEAIKLLIFGLIRTASFNFLVYVKLTKITINEWMQHIIMCKSVNSTMFMRVSDNSKLWKMCHKAIKKVSKILQFVRDYLKTQKKCG